MFTRKSKVTCSMENCSHIGDNQCLCKSIHITKDGKCDMYVQQKPFQRRDLNESERKYIDDRM